MSTGVSRRAPRVEPPRGSTPYLSIQDQQLLAAKAGMSWVRERSRDMVDSAQSPWSAGLGATLYAINSVTEAVVAGTLDGARLVTNGDERSQFIQGMGALLTTSPATTASAAWGHWSQMSNEQRYIAGAAMLVSLPKGVTSASVLADALPAGSAARSSKVLGTAGEIAGSEVVTGSSAHRAARWDKYQARGGEWPYERWSKMYENNMSRATNAHAAVDDYHAALGWGRREVTVDVEIDGVAYSRRIDIADVRLQRGVEYKTGYQTANADNIWEILRDSSLMEQGWDIQWILRDRASKPLLEQLRNAGIPYKVGKQ